MAQAKAVADRARVNLGYCTITSPVTGLIGSVPVFAGDQVNTSTYLTMVSGNAKMYAEFSVNEFTECGFALSEVTRDLHNSEYDAGNVRTEFEQKFADQGIAIKRLVATAPAK